MTSSKRRSSIGKAFHPVNMVVSPSWRVAAHTNKTASSGVNGLARKKRGWAVRWPTLVSRLSRVLVIQRGGCSRRSRPFAFAKGDCPCHGLSSGNAIQLLELGKDAVACDRIRWTRGARPRRELLLQL